MILAARLKVLVIVEDKVGSESASTTDQKLAQKHDDFAKNIHNHECFAVVGYQGKDTTASAEEAVSLQGSEDVGIASDDLDNGLEAFEEAVNAAQKEAHHGVLLGSWLHLLGEVGGYDADELDQGDKEGTDRYGTQVVENGAAQRAEDREAALFVGNGGDIGVVGGELAREVPSSNGASDCERSYTLDKLHSPQQGEDVVNDEVIHDGDILDHGQLSIDGSGGFYIHDRGGVDGYTVLLFESSHTRLDGVCDVLGGDFPSSGETGGDIHPPDQENTERDGVGDGEKEGHGQGLERIRPQTDNGYGLLDAVADGDNDGEQDEHDTSGGVGQGSVGLGVLSTLPVPILHQSARIGHVGNVNVSSFGKLGHLVGPRFGDVVSNQAGAVVKVSGQARDQEKSEYDRAPNHAGSEVLDEGDPSETKHEGHTHSTEENDPPRARQVSEPAAPNLACCVQLIKEERGLRWTIQDGGGGGLDRDALRVPRIQSVVGEFAGGGDIHVGLVYRNAAVKDAGSGFWQDPAAVHHILTGAGGRGTGNGVSSGGSAIQAGGFVDHGNVSQVSGFVVTNHVEFCGARCCADAVESIFRWIFGQIHQKILVSTRIYNVLHILHWLVDATSLALIIGTVHYKIRIEKDEHEDRSLIDALVQ